MSVVLQGTGVTKIFGGLTAMAEVDFTLEEGGIYGLIGPNGAGKSTLFNLITGYYPLTSGDIAFGGRSLGTMATYRRNQIGIARAFQISKPFPALTVLENVTVGAMFGGHGRGSASDIARHAIRTAGLEDVAHRHAQELTVGTLRKLEIARAIATGPKLLLADEPCAGLNPSETVEMVACLRSVREQGTTIWLVEHDMRAVTQVCERIFVIDAGRKVAEGTPDEVVNDPHVISAYLGEPAESILA